MAQPPLLENGGEWTRLPANPFPPPRLDTAQRERRQINALNLRGPFLTGGDQCGSGQCSGTDQFPRLEWAHARQFTEAERRAAQRVFAGSFFDELPVFGKAHLKSWKFFGQFRNRGSCHRVRFADNQRLMETEGSDKIDRLELPIRKNTIDDFESERNPFDMVKNGRRIRTSSQRLFYFENDFRL